MLFALAICASSGAAQNQISSIDSIARSKFTIQGFCLCDTKIDDLKAVADFKEVSVEEMDYPQKCGGSDTRFKGGIGYYSEKYPGLIFQVGNVESYIGKIRLTKQFKGNLPNGSYVDLSTMKLRDVFVIYPELKDTWGSRGCSDYWNFSDKTISFFVKIDKSIQPQFPIRESDYLDEPINGVDLVTSCFELLRPFPQVDFFRPGEPMLFVDSIRTNQSFLEKAYSPDELASISVIKGDDAIRIGGDEAKNGIIYIFTKQFIRKSYWDLFRRTSSEYAASVQSPTDSDVLYILNGKVLREDLEKELAFVTKHSLTELRIIDKRQLKKQFNERGRVGVLLTVKK